MPAVVASTPPALSFQPVLDLRDGRIEYIEVYAQDRRLRQLAEADGSMAAFDLAVLRQCLPLLATGHRLALNVSPSTLLTSPDAYLPPLLELPPERRPLLELNDAYLLPPETLTALRTQLAALDLGLNHYQGTALEDELLELCRPVWAKLDGDCLRQQLAGHGCNALQQAVASCQRYGVRLAVTRVETPDQLLLTQRLCGLRWGQGRLLAAEQATPDFPARLPLPQLPELIPTTALHAESCWHCLYSRLLAEDGEELAGTATPACA